MLVSAQTKEETVEWLNTYGNDLLSSYGTFEFKNSEQHNIFPPITFLFGKNDSLVFKKTRHYELFTRNGSNTHYYTTRFTIHPKDIIKIRIDDSNSNRFKLIVETKDRMFTEVTEQVSFIGGMRLIDSTTHEKSNVFSGLVKNSKSIDDLNRIVKALTHYAEASGAQLEKVIDKDTF
jgi:hypothetical protein